MYAIEVQSHTTLMKGRASMPTRDFMGQADLSIVLNGVTYYNPVSRAIGTKQSISALNNTGKFVPGTFRANPVVLGKFVALGEPTSSTSEDVYLANRGKINGHVCAVLANSMKMTPAWSNFDFYTSWDATAAGHSLQKAYASMKEAELDVGVMLGELRETIEGLRNPIQALRQWLRLWNKLSKRGKRPKLSDTLNMLSGSWLEWRYGIQPLIYSIQDIIEHVQSQSRAMEDKLLRQRGKVQYEKSYKLTGSTMPQSYSLEGTTEILAKHKYVSKVFYKMTRPLTWQERYGLDALKIPGIALELTRLSFVWDWFFSVGDWLSSITPSDARSVHGSVTSQKSTVVSTTRATAIKFYGLVPAKVSGGLYEVTYEKLDRRINQPLALTPLVNRQKLSLKRTIDGISLLWQSLPKPRR